LAADHPHFSVRRQCRSLRRIRLPLRVGRIAKGALTADVTIAVEDRVDGKVEFIGRGVFGNISAGPGVERGERILLLGILRENDDGERAQADLKPMEEIESIAVVEKQVEEDQIRAVFANGGLGLRNGFGFAATFELFLAGDPIHQVLPKHSVVLNDEDTPLGNMVSDG
jgi:hypothetical protein